MADQSPDPGYQMARTGLQVEASLNLADSAVQPGDDLNTLGSGAQTSGKVPHADGAGGVDWLTPAGLSRLVSTFKNGTPSASEVIARFIAPAAGTTFPSGLSDSRMKAKVAATAQAVFTITHDGSSVGTITFAAAGTTGTFALGASIVLTAGQLLEVVAPGTPDATLADLAMTIVGVQGT